MPYPTSRKRKAYRDMGATAQTLLQEHRKVTYTTLLTSGKLNTYLVDIDEQAEEMFSRLVKQIAKGEGITG